MNPTEAPGKGLEDTPTCDSDETLEISFRDNIGIRVARNFQGPASGVWEDEGSRKRRKYRYRLDEAKVRYRGFKKLNLLPGGWPYVIKPLLVGLIPEQLLEKIKDLYYDRRLEKKGTKI